MRCIFFDIRYTIIFFPFVLFSIVCFTTSTHFHHQSFSFYYYVSSFQFGFYFDSFFFFCSRVLRFSFFVFLASIHSPTVHKKKCMMKTLYRGFSSLHFLHSGRSIHFAVFVLEHLRRAYVHVCTTNKYDLRIGSHLVYVRCVVLHIVYASVCVALVTIFSPIWLTLSFTLPALLPRIFSHFHFLFISFYFIFS